MIESSLWNQQVDICPLPIHVILITECCNQYKFLYLFKPVLRLVTYGKFKIIIRRLFLLDFVCQELRDTAEFLDINEVLCASTH